MRYGAYPRTPGLVAIKSFRFWIDRCLRRGGLLRFLFFHPISTRIMVAKTQVFQFDDSAAVLRALAHPIRMAIVDLLDKKGPTTVGDIQEALEIDQAVTSHHLKIMRYHGIVSPRRDGRHTYYELTNAVVCDILKTAKTLAG